MRKLILGICALGLIACQPNVGTNDVATNSNTVVTNVEATNCGITHNTLSDEKALFVAETAYNVPADAYVRLSNTLPANVKATVRPKLIQLYNYLKLARTAYNAGDGCSLKRYSELADALGKQVSSLLPK
jgi:hypothetical protein